MINNKSSEAPSFSIIVPIYNTELYLHRCLGSISEQQGNVSFEVIMVDDGSEDNSENIAINYCKRDQRFQYFFKENGGLGSARNFGIKKARGSYLLFVDSDDYIDKSTLTTLNAAVQNNNKPDIVEFRMARVNEKMEVAYESRYHLSPDRFSILSCQSDSSACTKAYKRLLFSESEILFPESRLYEDVATIYKLYLYTSSIISIDSVLYCYVQRDGSITSKMNKDNIDHLFYSAESTAEYLANNNFLDEDSSGDYAKAVQLRFIALVIHCLKNIWLSNESSGLVMDVIKKLHSYYTDAENIELLKKVDIALLQDYIDNVLFCEERLAIKRKKQEIFSGDEIQSIDNLCLSRSINRLVGFISTLKLKYSRIAIYGNGVVGELARSILMGNICAIYDKDPQNKLWVNDGETLHVCHADDVSVVDFDIIFITVLGREENIFNFLVEEKKVSPEKIIFFNQADIY